MRTIGLLGGMSWESTALYYRIVNETVRDLLGGHHSARMVLVSVDFAEIEEMQHAGRWDEAGDRLAAAAGTLERAGADFLVIATNTMHVVADRVGSAIRIPILHIADPTVDAIRARGLVRVGLMATRFTMEKEFYRRRLETRGLEVLVPGEPDRAEVHRVIYDELCLGRVEPASRARYRAVIADLVGRGAEAIVFGCTEIGMLVDASDAPVPVFDTTLLHAEAAARRAVGTPGPASAGAPR